MLNDHLLELSDRLDKTGKLECADSVDGLISSGSLQKVAQYVGAIGYVLKQNRALGNCYRKKRAETSGPMQEIVLQCIKEYQDGQQYDNTEWSAKYAQVLEQNPENFDTLHLELIKILGEEAEMKEHLAKVEQTASLLKENGEEDDIINSVLSHVESLGGILKKEGSSYYPFKLAAAPTERNWWSRLWAPGFTVRGQDKNTDHLNATIRDNLSDIEQSLFVAQKTTDESQKQVYTDRINQSIEDLRATIKALRRTEAVVGRDESVPPYIYLDAFAQALFRMQSDPLNVDLFYKTQNIYSQFESRLKTWYATEGRYQRLQESLTGLPEMTTPESVNTMPNEENAGIPAGSDWSPDAPTSVSTDESTPVDPRKVEQAVNEILALGINPKMARHLLWIVFEKSNVPVSRELQEIYHVLTQKLKGSSPATASPAPNPANTAPDTQPSPIAGHHSNTKRRFAPRSPPSPAQYARREQIVKIADALDKIDKRLSDLIDKYLEDHDDLMFKLPDLANYSIPIKQEGYEKTLNE